MAQINKTDRNDARGIAQMMRAGLYRPVHAPIAATTPARFFMLSPNLIEDDHMFTGEPGRACAAFLRLSVEE